MVNFTDGHFSALADLTNDADQIVHVKTSELCGGDTQLARKGFQQQWAMKQSFDASESVSEGQDVGGNYIYTVNRPIELSPKSTITIPFIKPRVLIKRFVRYSFQFLTTNDKGKLIRGFTIKTNRFLPKGSIIVRDQDRFLGEQNIPDLTAEEEHDIELGKDADVKFKREISTLLSNEQNGTTKYRIEIIFDNKKSTEINVKFTEKFYGKYSVIISDADKNSLLKMNGNELNSQFLLASNSSQTINYDVVIYDQIKQY